MFGNVQSLRCVPDCESLEDVLASESAGPEPPLFTSAGREEKALKLSKSLTAKAGLRAAAVANGEAAFAVRGKTVAKLLSDLLEEYNQVRIISQGTWLVVPGPKWLRYSWH